MSDPAPVKLSEWTKKQLEQIREIEGHTSLDSVVKSLLMFRTLSIGYYMKTDVNPAGMLFKKQTSENFEKEYESVTDEVYKIMFTDEEGMTATIDFIKETDPDMAEQIQSLRELYTSDYRKIIEKLKEQGYKIEISNCNLCPQCDAIGKNKMAYTIGFKSKKEPTTKTEPKKEDEKNV